jgi:exopolyphosphatase/guanosine-5'-triphosphate,3'-diphosphate pyrophosphatase
MQERYHVDLGQAERVEALPSDFLAQVEGIWPLTDPAIEQRLRWAARLHEIGLDVAHSGYHRHGAYLLANADMAGFPREEQKLLAIMVGSHRRKPAIEEATILRALGQTCAAMTAVCGWRCASSRATAVALPPIKLIPRADALEMRFPPGWLDDHPLTVADFQLEIENLKSVGFRLRVFTAK